MNACCVSTSPRAWSSATASAVISTAPARVASTCCRYLGLARKASCSGPALSSGAKLLTRRVGSPSIRPPKRATNCSSVNDIPPSCETPMPKRGKPGARSFACPVCSGTRLLLGSRRAGRRGCAGAEHLDHLVRDIDARAHVNRFLEDEVIVLLLGDRLDHLVRAIEHRGKFLVAPLVQVFTEFALLALEIRVELGELALLERTVGGRHRGATLVELIRHRLELGRHVLQIMVS